MNNWNLVRPNAEPPTYATKNSSCFDLKACLSDGEWLTAYGPNNVETKTMVFNGGKVVIQPHYRVMVPTGLSFNLQEGDDIRLYSRSGLSLKHQIVLANGVGVVDNDYTDEVFVLLLNNSDVAYTVTHGDRIAQGEVTMPWYVQFSNQVDVEPSGSRAGGFGSTGK